MNPTAVPVNAARDNAQDMRKLLGDVLGFVTPEIPVDYLKVHLRRLAW